MIDTPGSKSPTIPDPTREARWRDAALPDESAVGACSRKGEGNSVVNQVRSVIVARPGACLVAGLVMGGIAGWLASRLK